MRIENGGHPPDKHIDTQELNALVQPSVESGQESHALSPEAVREARRHVEACGDCRRKLAEHQQFLNQLSNVVASGAISPRADCPNDGDVEWHEVVAGLWPELKAKQLIMHAALCDYCGPRLRAATSVSDDPTPREEIFLAQLKAPSRPVAKPKSEPAAAPASPRIWSPFLRWRILAPALALMMIAGVISTRFLSSPRSLSGAAFAEFAVRTHRHSERRTALDVRSDSQQVLNQWFITNVPFSLALPASPPAMSEEWPHRLEGARLVPVAGKTAVYIAYQMQTGPVGLIVAPDSLAVASGGVVAEFNKVTFHYLMVEGYKVVTWSLHGNTYALVSQEGNSTQRSCMVCHSAMRDRDLSQTPTPLQADPAFQ